MADSVVKIRIDSAEYDAKLKKASDALTRYFDTVQKGGGTLDKLDSDVMDAVKAMGTMDTAATSAKGKIAELTKVFTELHVRYQQMSDTEKSSPIGKEMASSLDQLKQRISEAKGQIDNANKAMGDMGQTGSDAGGILGVLKDKFTINIDALKLFNAGVTAAKAALDVAKDAFMASEASVDEWGRIMDSSKSLYEGFLNSINNGDISGFLGRIGQIVSAARQAYDELDRLGTMKTIQAPQISAQTTENERLRMMIQTRRYIAPVDGRRASMQNGQLLTDAQINVLERQLQNGMNKVTSLVGNEVKQTSRAIDAVYRRQATELGMSLKEFREGTSSMAEFDRRVAGAAKYNEWQRQHSTVDLESGRLIAPRTGNPYAQYKGWDVFRVDGKPFNDLAKLITQRDQQASQAYSIQSQGYRAINRAEGITVRGTRGGKGGNSTGTSAIEKTEMQINSEQIQKLTQEYIAASAERRQAIQEEIKVLQERNKEIQNLMNEAQGKTSPTRKLTGQDIASINTSGSILGSDFLKPGTIDYKAPIEAVNLELERLIKLRDQARTPEEWQRLNEAISGVKQGRDDFTNNSGKGRKNEAVEGIKDVADKIGGIGSSLSSITGGIEQMGLEIPEEITRAIGVLQGMTSILMGISSLITIITTIQGAKAVPIVGTFLANGGVIHAASGIRVPGNTYSMDQVPAMLNSGEVVLNRAQAGNLASQLNDENTRGGYQPSHISGEQIYLAMNRYLKRTGRGEIVTWK